MRQLVNFRLAWLALLALPWAPACVGSSSVVAPGPRETGPVNDTTDAVADSSMDVVDTALPDVAPMDVMQRCTSNMDCAGNPAGAVCDTVTGRCVGCVAMPDSCAGDQHCDMTSNTCVRGCHSDEGCRTSMGGDDAGAGGDAGPLVAGRCNTTAHTCVQCITNDHCPAGMQCMGNLCVMGCDTSARCAMGEVCCSGGCVDTQTNPANCMMCGRACTIPNGTAGCAAGACTVGSCTDPFRDCDSMVDNGCETNTQSSVTNCGGCGRTCAAPAHATGTCAMGVCGFACETGFADCNAMESDGCEVDLNQDPAHCGMCPTMCATANGAPACAMGVCATGMCTPGFSDCDMMPGNGCETNTQTSTSACGACGMACMARPGAAASCVAGACVLGACLEGFADCDGMADNGCETNTQSSGTNCGMCGTTCTAAGGAAVCVMGRCTVGTCDTGLADCDGMTGTGCESDTRTSTAHCGTCGNVCPIPNRASAGCVAGVCGIGACVMGFGDCNMMAGDGCEVELATDGNHCGACGTRCALANATAVCRGGSCAVGTCDAGFADCDGNASNGCEVNTSTTLTSCGACGRVCGVSNGMPVCRAGACAVASCDTGFLDCDMNPANGCEVVSPTDTNNCGGCGVVCPTPPTGAAVCVLGRCGIGTCPSGFSDCNGLLADGCEVASSQDTNNCGGCGIVCPRLANGASVCSRGVCGLGTCNTGFADCNSMAGDGCEVNTNSSLSHCGGCGRSCAPGGATGVCTAGGCAVLTCNTGFANCNGNPVDGCEVNTTNSPVNCGGCSTRCTPPMGGGASCVLSACILTCPLGQTNCGGTCRTTGGACSSAGSGGCAQMGTTVCSGTSTACSVGPRTSGTCSSPTSGSCNASGDCVCPSGQTNCSGVCRNTATDPNNCGTCARVCPAPTGGSATCSGSTCSSACPSGQSNCGGVCRTTGTSCTSSGSGGCASTGSLVCSGTSSVCSATPRTSGTCTTPTGGSCDGSGNCVCPSGQTACSGVCRNTLTDNMGCGSSCAVCRPAAVGSLPRQTCVSGVCVGTGSLRFNLTWDRNGDMDLHVLPPGCSADIDYTNTSACGGRLDVDNTSGRGPENIFWAGDYPRGTYYVCAEAYSSVVANAIYTLVVLVNDVEVRRVTGTRGRTDGNTACGPGFNQLTIAL